MRIICSYIFKKNNKLTFMFTLNPFISQGCLFINKRNESSKCNYVLFLYTSKKP